MQVFIISNNYSLLIFFIRSVVTSVEFHPKEENLLVTAGLDRKA
jgi:hypothetical protein